ncbi:MAG: CopG family transcriptional regulator [Actinomycetota bacterium]
MRTTISFDPDVASALDKVRREKGIGLSQAANELIRAGLKNKPGQKVFRQKTHNMGLKIDVTNVAEALEILEGPAGR